MSEQVKSLPIGKLGNVKDWELKILDPSSLPDVESIEREECAKVFNEKGKWRYIALAIGLVIGLVILVFSNLLAGIIAMVFLAGFGFGLAHFIIKSMGLKEAQRLVMPDIAKMCGGTWHEDCSEIVPDDNPLARMVDSPFSSNSRHHHRNQNSLQIGSLELGSNNAFREDDSWIEYKDGIKGRIPQWNLPYGVVNMTVCKKEYGTDSEGKPTTETHKYDYVLAWVDFPMPLSSLELKRRWLKGGGMFGRLFDKLDTKFSDQQVLELESEQFNQSFKVEVADNSEAILVRRMFSPKVMDAFLTQRIPLHDDIIFRNNRVWISDDDLDQFNARSAAKTLDYMIYRAQLIARVCDYLAKEVGTSIQGEN